MKKFRKDRKLIYTMLCIPGRSHILSGAPGLSGQYLVGPETITKFKMSFLTRSRGQNIFDKNARSLAKYFIERAFDDLTVAFDGLKRNKLFTSCVLKCKIKQEANSDYIFCEQA